MPADPRLRVASVTDLLAAIPYLLGFHPANSAVVVALRAQHIVFALRYDLPGGDPGPLAAMAAHHRVDGAFLVAYGTDAQVRPAVARLAEALERVEVPVLVQLRVRRGRYWHLHGDDPAEGRAFDSSSTEVAATATLHGIAPRPDREALVAEFAPVAGAGQAAMIEATTRAEDRMVDLGRRAPDAAGFARVVLRAGSSAVRAAERRHREGGRLTDDETAWLAVLLLSPSVLSYAWERLRAAEDDGALVLWADVVRRAQADYVCAPACLLSFCAWELGRGVEARAALDRALAADPDHETARLLDDLLCRAVPPTPVRGRAA